MADDTEDVSKLQSLLMGLRQGASNPELVHELLLRKDPDYGQLLESMTTPEPE